MLKTNEENVGKSSKIEELEMFCKVLWSGRNFWDYWLETWGDFVVVLKTKSISAFLGDGSFLYKIDSSFRFQNRSVQENLGRYVRILNRRYHLYCYNSYNAYRNLVCWQEKQPLTFCFLGCWLYPFRKSLLISTCLV